MHKIELLAPAGNFECMVAAVQSGADAVYLAGTNFGARSFADNFSEDEMERAVDYCHIRGVKVYVTVNTLVLDSEIVELEKYLRFISKIGVDAIIVQDLGVLEVARRIVPELPIHASTQMTVCSGEGVNFLKRYNIKRVVLSRELSIDEIKDITNSTNLEIEVFAHGALCMCYSGQCLLSSIIGSRSGNRGKCAQPCRLPYSVNNGKNKAFFMSLKDLSSLEYIEKLTLAGVSSLKIEGRMKGPLYVAAVVGIYRKYIDNPQKVSPEDIGKLDAIFNRGGLTDGYLTGKTGKDMFALDKPDNPYRKNTSQLEKELLSLINGEKKKLKICGKVVISENKKPVISVGYENIKTVYEHDKLPEKAMKTSIDATSVLSQIAKTGGTPFEFEELNAEVEEGLFLSAGELNKIRREALALFEKELIQSFKRKGTLACETELQIEKKIEKVGFVCEVTTVEQLKIVLKFQFEKIYVPIHIIKKHPELTDKIRDKVVIVPPGILREKDFKKYLSDVKNLLKDGYDGVLVNSLSVVNELEGFRLYGGFRLNIFNSVSLSMINFLGFESVELSPELNLKQIGAIKKSVPVQTMVYGRLPLMISENCIIRNDAKCPCKGDNKITDRMGMEFPVIKDGDICRSVVLNCKKTFMAKDIEKIKNAGVNFFRLYFSDESAKECEKVCEAFLSGTDYKPNDFTNGHFYKGVTR